MTAAPPSGYLPGRHPIEAYGRGGFRFGGMSHRGSILLLPSGVKAWPARAPADVTPSAVADVVVEAGAIDLLLVGMGDLPTPLDASTREALRAAGLRVDVMATAPAARTFNVLLAEGRRVAAALLAVG